MYDVSAGQRRPACEGEDGELFFPVGNAGPAQAQIAAAKAVCRRCPVLARCLMLALTSDDRYGVYAADHGVWGGLTSDERKAITLASKPVSVPVEVAA
jgi:WhiB family redox-sensing transcriptional regulator